MRGRTNSRSLQRLLTDSSRASSRQSSRRSFCAECRKVVPSETRSAIASGGLQVFNGLSKAAYTASKIAYPHRATLLARQRRTQSTVSNANPDSHGPMDEYNDRVASGRLRDDEHQRGIIQSLQHLHDELAVYHAPPIVHPTLESLQPPPKSLFGSLFSSGPKKEKALKDIPENLPRGLYLYGDVGSGKTMLMDMFYDTLPHRVTSKTRIHFHNFMQDVHKRLHKMKLDHGVDIDAVPFIAADIAEQGNVLCFDEFQCTDVADAMILRRLLESLMSHGVVLVTTSNRHPDELYINGIQRGSFIPCINLLKNRLHVINLDSPTDYRKIPRPPSGVYHAPLDNHASSHAEKWFRFLGDPNQKHPRAETQTVWGREIKVPRVSGKAAMFTFDEIIGRAMSAADYIELTKSYNTFVVTNVPGMTHRERDLARRFITFIDAVYESRAKLVLTTAVPLTQLFMSKEEIKQSVKDTQDASSSSSSPSSTAGSNPTEEEGADLNDAMRMMMDDLGLNMAMLKSSSIFSGDEERFAFARALSRLAEMGSQEWVERGMGLEKEGGKKEKESWERERGEVVKGL